ncbi:MAG: hypothetical protein QM817_28800 [Archangium sp.]
MRPVLLGVLILASACQPEVRVVKKQTLDSETTGISIDESGRRLIWQAAGLQELLPSGGESMILLRDQLPMALRTVEDAVAVSGGRLAFVMRDEGYIVDLNTGGRVSRFCYVPEWDPQQQPVTRPVISQLSKSLAWSEDEGRLYVQPQTFEDGVLTGAQLGEFEPGFPQPREWHELQTNFLAGGMAAVGDQKVYLGVNQTLHLYDGKQNATVRSWDLSPWVDDITGLAFDKSSGTFLVADGVKFVELEIAP